MAISETGDSTRNPSGLLPSMKYLIVDMGIDLKLTLFFVMAAMVFIFVPFFEGTAIRYAFGLLLVLFMPGYAFICAVFPAKGDPAPAERAVLSAGFSIALVPAMGLLLNYTAWGVRLEPIVICIVAFILVCSCVANLRRHGLPVEDRFSIDIKSSYKAAFQLARGSFHDRTQAILSTAVIVCLLFSIVAVTYAVVVPRSDDKYTEFYINGPGGKAADYPTQYTLGEQKPIIIGISNHEMRNMSYTLNVSLGGTSPLYSEQVKLADNETWEKLVYLKPDHAGNNMTMSFLLYDDGNISAPYRTCSLFVNVTAPHAGYGAGFELF
jgi:uncharacterized membrane protein